MSDLDSASTQAREKAGGGIVVLVVLALLLLAGGGWAAAYLGAGDNVPRGTTIAGVEVGGRARADAAAALEAGLADRADASITVLIDGERRQVSPDKAGLSVDYLASVSAAGGQRTWNLQRLWDYYTDGDDLEAVVAVDETAMESLIQRLGSSVATPPRDGQVLFEGDQVSTVEPEAGAELDAESAREAIVAAYLQLDQSEQPAVLALRETQPDIDADDVRRALDSFANPAVSGPVTLVFGDSPIRLQPRDFGDALAMEAKGGKLVPVLDEDLLTAFVDSEISDSGAPVDATVALVDGKPKVVPARPGVTFEPAAVSKAFLELVSRPEGEREIEVEASVADPEFTTADARQLKIRERVSTFTTYFPYAEYRNINIGRAAEIINGTLLKPGEEFSLNDIVGERTRENGFTEGFVISDGIFKEDLGGGVSQMATTTFNAMFFAGLKDIEHKPHSFYIDRYPVGREATVAFGAIDLRFENDTPYGVLIEATVAPSTPSAQGVVTVSMYSTKFWDITTTASGRYAFVPPATRTLETPDCYPNEGYSGFQVDVERYFRKPGESQLDHQETFHTNYTPSDTVICQ